MICMSEYAYLGTNVRRYRVDARLSQLALARLAGAGFSQSYISEIERGLKPSDPAHVERLATVLGVRSAALLRRVRVRRLAAAA